MWTPPASAHGADPTAAILPALALARASDVFAVGVDLHGSPRLESRSHDGRRQPAIAKNARPRTPCLRVFPDGLDQHLALAGAADSGRRRPHGSLCTDACNWSKRCANKESPSNN